MDILNLGGGVLGLYKVVPPNEAHVRVMFDKKEVFMSREGYKPSYWKVPFVTRMTQLPLTNIRIDVPDVKLNDKDMAKFMCDVVCFVNIKNPIEAAERTEITTEEIRYEDKLPGIANDFRAVMESVGRTVATKQSILEIYMDRSKLDEAVTKECQDIFPKWGLELVDLEIKDLKDLGDSTIISDIERKIAAQINADARIKVANEAKRAAVIEAEAQKDAEFARAKNEEEWKKRQLEKETSIAKSQQATNEEIVKAERVLIVQRADVKRAETEKIAEGTKIKLTVEAEGEASKTRTIGNAEAEIIKAKKIADAEGTDKLAMAQQKFNDAATGIELIKANKEIQMKYAEAFGQALSKANINVVTDSTTNMFDGGLIGKIPVGTKLGVSMNQFLSTLNPEQRKQLEKALPALLKLPTTSDESKKVLQ